MTDDPTDVVRELRERLAAITAQPAARHSSSAAADGPPSPAVDRQPTAPAADGDLVGSVPAEEYQRAKAICLRLLTDSSRSRATLERQLQQRGVSPDVITATLDRFTELGLVDDRAYAEAYVRSHHRGRGLGRGALSGELRRKGIDGDLAQDALAQIDAEAEERRAVALVAKRLPAAITAGPGAARRRLLAALDRRGYPAEMAIRVVDAALGVSEPS